jgi:hypothetical protein
LGVVTLVVEDGGEVGEVGGWCWCRGRGGREGRKMRSDVEREVRCSEGGGVGVERGGGVGAILPCARRRGFSGRRRGEVRVAEVLVRFERRGKDGGGGTAGPATAMFAVQV